MEIYMPYGTKEYTIKKAPTVKVRLWKAFTSEKLAYKFYKADDKSVSSDLYPYYFTKYASNRFVAKLNGWFMQRRLNKFAKENISWQN